MDKISTIVEVPEALHNAAQDFLRNNPEWDQDRLSQNAIALFLMQNGGNSNSDINGMYLDSLFNADGGKGAQ